MFIWRQFQRICYNILKLVALAGMYLPSLEKKKENQTLYKYISTYATRIGGDEVPLHLDYTVNTVYDHQRLMEMCTFQPVSFSIIDQNANMITLEKDEVLFLGEKKYTIIK